MGREQTEDIFASDETLLARFRAGDRAALAAVFRAYQDEVSRVLRAGFTVRGQSGAGRVPGLRDAFEVESACQEVFLRAFRPAARAAYDGERPYGHYLFGIARNHRIDQVRRRRPEAVPVEVIYEHPSDAPSPEAALERAERRARVARFLEGLDSRDREYVRHRFESGLSQQRAAESMGLTRIQGRRIEARVKSDLKRHLFVTTGEVGDEL
ncbi:MAG: RNA polymerase sigma factor [Planctomycetota bacterium]|jgi:RNA polymerase sigma-70 factor (ECF subfamily)